MAFAPRFANRLNGVGDEGIFAYHRSQFAERRDGHRSATTACDRTSCVGSVDDDAVSTFARQVDFDCVH
jgi:hypothetical protein